MFNLRGRIGSASLALALAATVHTAAAQQSYPQTLYWGSGLIDIPVAWVSPVTGDFTVGYSGQRLRMDRTSASARTERLNAQGAVSLSLLGRAEVGASLFSENPEWGFFGRALLIDARDFAGQPGLARWIPNLAVGMRNVGPFARVDRFGTGYDVIPGTTGNPHVLEPSHAKFNTGNTAYVVATKAFSLTPSSETGLPRSSVSFSLGYGNGLFSDDGGLGRAYATYATGGVFGGIEANVVAGSNTTFSLMVENNAWDYNAGIVADWRGVRAGAYVTEIGSSAPAGGSEALYNYSRLAFTVGWRGNVFGLAHDEVLKHRLAQLEQQRTMLRGWIAMRETRVAQLQREVARYEAQGQLALEDRRAQAERELRAEHEEIQQLRVRLRQLEHEQAVIAVASPAAEKPKH